MLALVSYETDEEQWIILKVKAGIYIDDAGTPGAVSKSILLDESRKSWCGVIIPPAASAEISALMEIFLAGVKKDYGVEELHCTDIYSGRGAWDIPPAERIEIFNLLSQIVIKFNLPIFYQTLDKNFKEDYADFSKDIQKYKMEFWDFQNISHMSLIFLIMRIKEGIKELREIASKNAFDHVFSLYVDEGIAKAGNRIRVPALTEDVFKEQIVFENSKDCVGIQIADFVAFICSKSQWIMMKKDAGKPFSRADKHILEIASKLNHWTLDTMVVDDITSSKEGFEFYLKRARMNALKSIPK